MGIPVGGMTPQEAKDFSSSSFYLPDEITLQTNTENQTKHGIFTNSFNAIVNYDLSVDQAYRVGRSSTLIQDFSSIIQSTFKPTFFEPIIEIDHDALAAQLSAYAESVTIRPIYPTVVHTGTEIIVNNGEPGTEIDIDSLAQEIISALRSGSTQPIAVNITTIDTALSEQQIEMAKARAQKFVDKSIFFEYDHQNYQIDNKRIFTFIDPTGGYKDEALKTEVESMAAQFDRPSQNPVFSFADGKVQEFKPAKDGIVVNQDKLIAQIKDILSDFEKGEEKTGEIVYTLPVSATPPAISMEDVNNLGIKELIGRGTSEFKHSIASRVYNVQLAASRINGVLIPPGEVFSFDKALGDVSALTGYKQAYIISDGKTTLGDGGGVCQVSTTFFRAALDAGLPIIERNAHSYRVGYYEQDSGPGVDATIYVPTVDLKIENNTPGHILVQAMADTTNMTLAFEFYGTSDGREATISEPVITSQSPPPEPEYTDDPTLPAGTIKQVDYAAWGAKVNFDYTVTRGDETLIEKTFYSNYRPWSAKYLRGTGPTS